ncbi:MAG: hypothetical protein WCM76_08845 [Bacteroidota bacterium]
MKTKTAMRDRGRPAPRSGKVKLAMFATLALLIVASAIMVLNGNRMPKNDQLYEKYNTGYQADMTQRDGVVENTSFANGMDLFTAKDFGGAISALSNVQAGDQNYTASIFYRGLAYMQTNDHMNAIADFTAVANAGQTNLAADAQWFLALCYLKVGEETDAKDILTTIAKSNPYDGEKATELLSQL